MIRPDNLQAKTIKRKHQAQNNYSRNKYDRYDHESIRQNVKVNMMSTKRDHMKLKQKGQDSPRHCKYQKENYINHENTPRHAEMIIRSMQDVEQLSQIKFISKECSSIKEKMSEDIISYSNSDNQLQEFSCLFDKLDDKDSHDFQIEICGIQDSQSEFSIQDSIRHHKMSAAFNSNRQSSSYNVGKIKKNKSSVATTLQSSSVSQGIDLTSQIYNIFMTLDGNQQKILSKGNCSSERLCIQLNYLIGSLINKIKVMNRHYKFSQFQKEFKVLIEDSEKEELNQILLENQKKRVKNETHQNLVYHIQDFQNDNGQEQRQSLEVTRNIQGNKQRTNNMNAKLDKINTKLNLYLTKNDLVPANTYQNKALSCSKPTFSSNQEPQLYFAKRKEKGHQILITNDTQEYSKPSNQNSKVSLHSNQSKVVQVSLRKDVQVIKGYQGSSFELNFMELNKHLY